MNAAVLARLLPEMSMSRRVNPVNPECSSHSHLRKLLLSGSMPAGADLPGAFPRAGISPPSVGYVVRCRGRLVHGPLYRYGDQEPLCGGPGSHEHHSVHRSESPACSGRATG